MASVASPGRLTDDDQLTLELRPSLPGLPAILRPMIARPHPAPFDSEDHLFEPSWGGRRALAFVEAAVGPAPDGAVGFVTADGRPSLRFQEPGLRDLAPAVPELADLPSRIDARSAVIDGELVVVSSSGRPDPAGLEERLAGRSGPPVAYLAFDLLYLDGRPLLAEPLHRRRARLREVLAPGESVVAVPAIPGEGLALHDAVTSQGLAGVLARVRTSPYLPGIRSRLWKSIPARIVTPTTDPSDPTLTLDQAAPTSSPVLALIARLPLPFPDDD